MDNKWTGFYKKSIQERKLCIMNMFPGLFSMGLDLDTKNDIMVRFDKVFELLDSSADTMIENCVGSMRVPFGIGLNFVLDGNEILIPMAIEEPSVIAAFSGAAKLLCSKGHFEAFTSERNIIYAQVQLLDIPDDKIDSIIEKIHERKAFLLDLANQYAQSMKNRGGGAVDIICRKIKKSNKTKPEMSYWLVVHVHIDVCDAMGANCASTIAEGIAPWFATEFGARIGFRIVSNLAPERLSRACFRIAITELSYKGFSGIEIANRIVESYEWAQDDVFRAVTFNKGIMNGIDALLVATGQDFRAIEASVHAWATLKSGTGPNLYQPLSSYRIEKNYLIGELKLPLNVGTMGGAIQSNPAYQFALGLMGQPDSKKLARILVCVGLAQNFAALRALSSEGIQRGHMSLHAENIAIAAGAPLRIASECALHMIETNRISQVGASEFLRKHFSQQSSDSFE